ncbi:MAG: hypothetical protein JKX91_14160 [Rhizobiaceae bacterium]|nr:hypothetical protein [Rhizobiaceae bacterium]
MLQLTAFALIGGVAWVGYKAFRTEMQRAADELEKTEKKREEKEVPSLKEGKDGVFRPDDE